MKFGREIVQLSLDSTVLHPGYIDGMLSISSWHILHPHKYEFLADTKNYCLLFSKLPSTMPSFIKIIQFSIQAINNFNEWIGKAISCLTLLMVITTFVIVLLRNALGIVWEDWGALQESVSYMHVVVFMLGFAYTLKHNAHVRVDIIYQRCSHRTQAWIDCIGTLLLLLPVCVFIIWSSWEYVLNAWKIKESSRNSGGLPGVYLLKTTIIIMAGLLILQGISLFLNNLIIALDLEQEPE